MYTAAQVERARARAFLATHFRSAPPAIDYTQFTDQELQSARAEVLNVLSGDGATDADADRADAIAAEVERRNAVTTATNERRQRLAGLQIVPRYQPPDTRPSGNNAPPVDPPTPRGSDGANQPFDLRAALQDGANNFRSRGFTGTSILTEVPDIRALITTTTFPMNPVRQPGIIAPPDQTLRVADLLDQQTMTGGSIEYVRELTNTALTVAAEVAEGAAKPEAAMTFDVVALALATIAVWIPITRQAAEDDAQLEGYIRGRLAYACERRLDGQIINGNGTAPNIRGILNTAGIQVQLTATDTLLVSVRKAITKTQIAEYPATGIVMHPSDWEEVELTQDATTGTFLFTKDLSSMAQPRLWGLPVVPTVAIAANTSLVGSFREAATLWRKGTTRILISDSHSDNFTKNILVILAELRAQLAVYAPAAFVRIAAA